jgi:hypothetical protein
MRLLLFLTLFVTGFTASADQVLDLGSYFVSVRTRGTSIVYTHDVYDSDHVPRFALMKTVIPVKRDGRRGEDYSYAFGVKESSGNVVWTVLDEDMYKNLREKIEKTKLENAIRSWTHGCQVRAIIGDRYELVGFFSLCEDMNAPAGNSTGTIEADSKR